MLLVGLPALVGFYYERAVQSKLAGVGASGSFVVSPFVSPLRVDHLDSIPPSASTLRPVCMWHISGTSVTEVDACSSSEPIAPQPRWPSGAGLSCSWASVSASLERSCCSANHRYRLCNCVAMNWASVPCKVKVTAPAGDSRWLESAWVSAIPSSLRFNAPHPPLLRCAVLPKGPASGCSHLRPGLKPRNQARACRMAMRGEERNSQR